MEDKIIPNFPLFHRPFSHALRTEKENIDQGGVDVAMKKKTVHISGKEVSFYNKLFDLVDYDEDDKVGLWICRHG